MHSLSIPTWVIHVSSVIEWIAAIGLIWNYAGPGDSAAQTLRVCAASALAERRHWRSLSWGMLPALVSAMCACVWHFFDNSPQLEWLVTLQGAMTLVGNSTMALAAWWIWRSSQEQVL